MIKNTLNIRSVKVGQKIWWSSCERSTTKSGDKVLLKLELNRRNHHLFFYDSCFQYNMLSIQITTSILCGSKTKQRPCIVIDLFVNFRVLYKKPQVDWQVIYFFLWLKLILIINSSWNFNKCFIIFTLKYILDKHRDYLVIVIVTLDEKSSSSSCGQQLRSWQLNSVISKQPAFPWDSMFVAHTLSVCVRIFIEYYLL